MNTLLYGNGINIVAGAPSWNNLLRGIFTNSNNYDGVPLTMNYDSLFLCQNRNELEVKNQISSKLKVYKGYLIEKVSNTPFDAYMTTNYDRTLELYFDTQADGPLAKERRFSLFRRSCCMRAKKTLSVWHIHGDVKFPQSIMLGFDQYCRYLRKIELYVFGKLKNISEVSMEERIKNRKTSITSWVDLFFVSDIYIVGFGLDYSEIDIWWLFFHRARLLRKGITIKNKIFYYDPCVDASKNKMLNTLNICVNDDVQREKSKRGKDFWEKWYNDVFDAIENKIQN